RRRSSENAHEVRDSRPCILPAVETPEQGLGGALIAPKRRSSMKTRRTMTSRMLSTALLLASLLASCSTASGPPLDGPRILDADTEPQNWLTHGRTYSEQRFSPLAKINATNVGRLGLIWQHDIGSRTTRGVEATPIVVDGVMYTTGAWSHVLALDAKTGKLLW